MDTFRLDGQAAIITGGSKGLGREIAEHLAAAGARLVLVARETGPLRVAAEEIRSAYEVAVETVAGDVANESTAREAVELCWQTFGRLDILINNAGINRRGAIDSVKPNDFDDVMATNVKGVWLFCRAAATTFRAQRSGRVINIASTLGLVGMADRSLYCTSKGAIVQLTRELAMEWAPIGVTVNAICPGPFETEMNRSLVADKGLYHEFAAKTAMKRWGRPGELGPVARFLASKEASYITGAILPVDGGWVAY